MPGSGTNGSNGNGRGPVQTAPTRPPEREIAPRYPIPDPPDEEEDLDEGEEGGDPEDGELVGGRTGTATAPESGLPPIFPQVSNEQLRWHLRRTAHMTALHAVRVPVYVLRTLRWAPIGIGRATVKLWRWETNKLGRDHLDWAPSSEEYLKLKKDHRETIHDRLVPTVLAGCLLSAALMVGYYNWPLHTLATLGGAVWLAGWYGAPRGSIIEHVEPAAPELRKWDVGVIRRAFEKAGLSKPADKDGFDADPEDRMMFLTDPARDGEHGTSCRVALPLGKTSTDTFKAKAKLASGLRVGKMQLFITPDRDNENELDLYIADRDPYRGEPVPTPLLDIEKLDFWEGFPFGVDQRGREVWISMLWTHMLVGSIPRFGKTQAARLVACAAALDPNVRLLVYNGKGDGAWGAFEKVAHRYGNGVPDDVVDDLILTLEQLEQDMHARMSKLNELRHRVPESRITREMANDPHLDMPLTLLVIDEMQVYASDKKPVQGGPLGRKLKRGDYIMEMLTNIARVAPSAGIMLLLATQRPDAVTSNLITSLRDNMGTRVCFRMMSPDPARMVLGTPPPGKSPTQFQEGHEGVAVLVGGSDADAGATDAGRIIRTHFGDDDMVEAIIDGAWRLREKLGTLTGYAAGETPTEKTPDRLLDHILETTLKNEDRLAPAVALDRLQVQHPEIYSGWSEERLRQCLRDAGVDTSHQINRTNPKKGERKNVRGMKIDEVKEALARKLAGAGSNGSNGNNDH